MTSCNFCNLFDFDGTLFNTTDALFLAYKQAMFEIVKKNLTKEAWSDNFGNHISCICKELEIDEDDTIKIRKLKYKNYPDNFLNSITKIDKMIRVASICKHNYIVSSTEKPVIIKILQYNSLDNLFEGIFDYSCSTKQKPHPEPYLNAINTLNFDRYNIFEDSTAGIQSAIETKQLLTGKQIKLFNQKGMMIA